MNSLEFAIAMELDGVRYYTEQAEKNSGNKLNAIFLLLARDEKEHARILEKKRDGLEYVLEDNYTLKNATGIFEGESDFISETKQVPDELDLYVEALDKEKQSIELYEKFLAEAANEHEAELFKFLIGQEREHHSILESVVELINRPNDWVEDAEFGVREDY